MHFNNHLSLSQRDNSLLFVIWLNITYTFFFCLSQTHSPRGQPLKWKFLFFFLLPSTFIASHLLPSFQVCCEPNQNQISATKKSSRCSPLNVWLPSEIKRDVRGLQRLQSTIKESFSFSFMSFSLSFIFWHLLLRIYDD